MPTNDESSRRKAGPILGGLLAFSRWADAFAEWTGKVAQWVVIPTVVVGVVSVILRYSGQLMRQRFTSNAVIETQWYLYSVIFLVGFAYVLKHQINVRVDFWYANQVDKRKAWIDFIGHWVGLVPLCLIGIWVSFPQALQSIRVWEMSPDPDGLPRGPIKALLAVAFVLLLIQALAEQVKLYAVITDRAHLVTLEHEPEQPIRIE